MKITIEIHDAWLGRPEDLRKILATIAGLECPPTGAGAGPRRPAARTTPARTWRSRSTRKTGPGAATATDGTRGTTTAARRATTIDEEEDPPTDGRQLLGWAAKQVPDAKGRVIAVGKKRGYPSRILDWTPQQVAAAYRTARALARASR